MKLDVRNASVGYDWEKPAQKQVNFSVETGEVCCILGPNGCGKTTLVKTILGLLPLLGGSVTIDGEDITRWSARRLSECVAYVAQRHEQPFPYEVRDVVMLGRITRTRSLNGKPSQQDYNIVENALEEMGIAHLREKPYLDISGGELQMVMFARALVQEPRFIIMDEPRSALDYGNAVRVIEKVRDLAEQGYGILMITHNPDHAFMTGANVALFTRNKPMKFGSSYQIITRENIQDAYGVSVKLVEFTHDNEEVMRMCAPEFGGKKREASGVSAAPEQRDGSDS
jgi:iron complex transport system ATP-binding protein